MKIQRSHFRLITLVLLCAFLAVMLLCAVRIGLVTPPVPGEEEGNTAVSEESMSEPENLPEPEDSDPESSEPENTAFPPEEYVTTGL